MTTLLDLSWTAHTTARTGIQRVCRALPKALLAAGANPLAVTHDPYASVWRPLAGWEQANLNVSAPGRGRRSRWPWSALLTGWVRRLRDGGTGLPPRAEALVVPEIFSPSAFRALPALFERVKGPRVALFHDAIALRRPDLTPPGTVSRFPGYLRELLAFDGIAAVSEDSHSSLLDYWRWAGFTGFPPVVAIPLGIDPPPAAPAVIQPGPAGVPTILSVGSIEGRKNHLALLEAAENLWALGKPCQLHLIGLAQAQTGRAALARIRQLQAAGRPLRYDGPVDEDALHAAYRECAFTVYPSLVEGFGLPVLESLGHGKPCVCSARGALGESARGGGCLALESVDGPSLTSAMAYLLDRSDERSRLAAAAAARVFKTWPRYAAELLAWMHTLPRRPAGGPIDPTCIRLRS